MSNKVSEFGTLTYENMKKAHEKLLEQNTPKVYLPPIVFLSNGQFKELDYLATKYPKGAIQISKIDKKKSKKQSLRYKRYFIKQEIYPIDKIIVCEQEALRFGGINYLPYMNYGVNDE